MRVLTLQELDTVAGGCDSHVKSPKSPKTGSKGSRSKVSGATKFKSSHKGSKQGSGKASGHSCGCTPI